MVNSKILTYSDMIYRVAFHYMGNTADAEDIVHDVFVKWLEKRPEFNDENHEKAWFIRVTVNLCKNLRLSAWRSKTVGLDSVGEIPAEQESSILSDVAALPSLYSTVIYLHYYEGYSVREMAKILQCSELVVQSRLYRARQKLKHRLEDLADGKRFQTGGNPDLP